ncbi:histidinol phosphatase [Vibrio ishigakensis]|uniref:Histidinol phosphatase n=1 Tax=Vibrio ishigakensis TaxID=1481914 RepID=A0A0B8QB25_9VIBR|nr:histidinol phosphatase [Vibrio ishigakensis]
MVPAGENVTVSISMNLPEANNNGDKPDLKFVDVIAGYVTGKIDPTDPEFNKPFADDVSVIQSFEKDTQGWAEKDGKLTLSFTLEQVEQDMYIRLRGSNSEKGTPGYVDLEGNPVIDLEKTESDPNVVAWKDLWFYSNPIFITAN